MCESKLKEQSRLHSDDIAGNRPPWEMTQGLMNIQSTESNWAPGCKKVIPAKSLYVSVIHLH